MIDDNNLRHWSDVNRWSNKRVSRWSLFFSLCHLNTSPFGFICSFYSNDLILVNKFVFCTTMILETRWPSVLPLIEWEGVWIFHQFLHLHFGFASLLSSLQNQVILYTLRFTHIRFYSLNLRLKNIYKIFMHCTSQTNFIE